VCGQGLCLSACCTTGSKTNEKIFQPENDSSQCFRNCLASLGKITPSGADSRGINGEEELFCYVGGKNEAKATIVDSLGIHHK
jgi:hypothetical protein